MSSTWLQKSFPLPPGSGRPRPWRGRPFIAFSRQGGCVPTVRVTRRVHFSAAHRLHNPALSDEENARIFGLCNSPNWHGHNYELDVTVEGGARPGDRLRVRPGICVTLVEARRSATSIIAT